MLDKPLSRDRWDTVPEVEVSRQQNIGDLMSSKTTFWKRARIAFALLLAIGAVSLNGCIFVHGGGHHHHHDDWR
jgi:hypothetical protein